MNTCSILTIIGKSTLAASLITAAAEGATIAGINIRNFVTHYPTDPDLCIQDLKDQRRTDSDRVLWMLTVFPPSFILSMIYFLSKEINLCCCAAPTDIEMSRRGDSLRAVQQDPDETTEVSGLSRWLRKLETIARAITINEASTLPIKVIITLRSILAGLVLLGVMSGILTAVIRDVDTSAYHPEDCQTDSFDLKIGLTIFNALFFLIGLVSCILISPPKESNYEQDSSERQYLDPAMRHGR